MEGVGWGGMFLGAPRFGCCQDMMLFARCGCAFNTVGMVRRWCEGLQREVIFTRGINIRRHVIFFVRCVSAFPMGTTWEADDLRLQALELRQTCPSADQSQKMRVRAVAFDRRFLI